MTALNDRQQKVITMKSALLHQYEMTCEMMRGDITLTLERFAAELGLDTKKYDWNFDAKTMKFEQKDKEKIVKL